jgi:2-hydroxychromene-2-carboxylate isomerase
MTQRIEFFFDFLSPYSYLAHSQLAGLGVEVAYRPMGLLKVMEQVGNSPTTILSKAKGAYAMQDIGRWAARYGVPVTPGGMRRNDGAACARAVLAAARQGKASQATAAIYHAFWGSGVPLSNTAEIVAVLAGAGLDGAAIGGLIDSPEIAAELEANTNEAAARGVFGAPTIFVGEDMFFGNDRLDFVRERLAGQGVAA